MNSFTAPLDTEMLGDRGRQDQTVDLGAPQMGFHGTVHTPAQDPEGDVGPEGSHLVS